MNAIDLLVNEAVELHGYASLYNIMGNEGFGDSSFVRKVKYWWKKFIAWLQKWITAAGNAIYGCGKSIKNFWTGLAERRVKVKSSNGIIYAAKTKLDKIVSNLERNFHMVEERKEYPEEFINSESDADYLFNSVKNAADNISNFSTLDDEDDLNKFVVMESAGDEMNASFLKSLFDNTFGRLMNLLKSAKDLQNDIKRDSEYASRTVDTDNLEENTKKQTFFSKLAGLVNTIINGILNALKTVGSTIMKLITGAYEHIKGYKVTKTEDPDIDAPTIALDDVEVDVGGM